MIKSIEIWNFESHEHTLLENLSSGFNLIYGESNAGKTSIIRAIKVIGYNEFDPKSIRVGQKSCVIEATTDKGRVKVTKPSNEWEIEPNGKPVQYFEKIGKVILPEAAEILGLSMVQLGDIEMPVNVMNQLEGHFMLSELNGKTASGSMRAQIIDEISGLSGIETIIKEVSLDNHRWGREVKQLEDKISETAGQKHDPKELAEENTLLTKVSKAIADRDECVQLANKMETMCENIITEGESIERVQLELKGLPDPKVAKGILDGAAGKITVASQAKKLHGQCIRAAEKVQEHKDELDADVDTAGALTALEDAEKSLATTKSMKSLYDQVKTLRGDIGTTTKQHQSTVDEIKIAEEERDTAQASIKVCPLSQLPIGNCQGAIEVDSAVMDTVAEMAADPEFEQKCPESEQNEDDEFEGGTGDGLFDY